MKQQKNRSRTLRRASSSAEVDGVATMMRLTSALTASCALKMPGQRAPAICSSRREANFRSVSIYSTVAGCHNQADQHQLPCAFNCTCNRLKRGREKAADLAEKGKQIWLIQLMMIQLMMIELMIKRWVMTKAVLDQGVTGGGVMKIGPRRAAIVSRRHIWLLPTPAGPTSSVMDPTGMPPFRPLSSACCK